MRNSYRTGKCDVAIVGAGQLGSRYLQGMVKCSTPLRIWTIDSNPSSLARAEDRWIEAGGRHSTHEVRLLTSMSDLPQHLELAIIATSAHGRETVVSELANCAHVKYWVLEKVLAQSCAALSSLLENTAQADGRWVNTPRRMMKWHGQLREQLINRYPLHFQVGNNLWGLACNAIHFLDLATWFCNAPLVSVEAEGLDAAWIESKRPGFFEITGTLQATFLDGSTIQLGSFQQGTDFDIRIETPEGMWSINESLGLATGPQGQLLNGHVEYQSEMSTRLVDSILATGECLLPTLENSVQLHRPFLAALLHHWNRSGSHNDLLLPVT